MREPRGEMGTVESSVFGRYQIQAELGRGAMGIVYKAYDPKINRVVAIKTISLAVDDPAEEQQCRARFFREAEAAGRLSHPRIVPVFDIGENPETLSPYIVMEYVASRSLEEILSESGALPLGTTLKMIQEVAEALDYAHLQGVVHRDVKPSNILIGEDGHARITDFGIAQLNVVETAGSVWGTPAYMSPEQFRGESVDGRSDLFSLGVILYRMLTGHRPFQGNSAMTVARKIQNQEPVPAGAFNTELPPELDYVVGRAIAKAPGDRYQTGMEMVLDLQRLRDEIDAKVNQDAGSPRQDNREGWATEFKDAFYTSLPVRAALLSGSNRAAFGRKVTAQKEVSVRLDQPWQQVAIGFLTLGMLALAFVGLWWVIPAQGSDEIKLPPTVPTAARATVVRREAESEKARLFDRPAVNAPSRHIAVTKNPQISPPQPVASCLLGIAVEHHFATADLSLWIDNHASYNHALRGTTKKRVLLFKGVEGFLSDEVRLTPGDHQIRLRVLSADGSYDESGSISGTFAAGTTTFLTVDFDKHNRRMHLAFVPSATR